MTAGIKGGTYTVETKKRLLAAAPDYETARREVTRWIVRRRLSGQAAADLLGIGRSTLNQWIQGHYPEYHASDVDVLTGRIWLAVQQNPAPAPAGPPARFLETRNSAEIRRMLNACLRQRACAIVHGAPAEEKTFAAKCLLAERQASGHDDILYVYAMPDPSATGLLQEIVAAAGIAFRSNQKASLSQAIIDDFRARERMPMIVVDEAQHLLRRPYDALEVLRRLRDLTANDLAESRRDSYGCGLLLLGSHDLYQRFERDKFLLAQWRDRIQHKVQLTGMDAAEALTIAARELGNGRPARLGEELKAKILDRARETDPYTRVCASCSKPVELARETCVCGGKPKPCVFYSPRKLSIWIDRAREKRHQEVAC